MKTLLAIVLKSHRLLRLLVNRSLPCKGREKTNGGDLERETLNLNIFSY